MNRDEALRLSSKLSGSWPRGAITIDTWAEVLEEMHYGPCEAALRKLRDTADSMPSIAQFRHAYQAELGTARVEKVDCGACGGDGWETVVVGPTEYRTVMQPCRCPNGRNVKDVHRRIIVNNDNELARLGHTPVEHATSRPDWITGHPLFGDNE